MFKSIKTIQSERGISLVEVVASIVIIGIILISFFGLFMQSNKIGKASETIIDATYVAQMEMENVYQISRNTPYSNLEEELEVSGYLKIPNDSTNEYTKEEIMDQRSYTFHLSFTQPYPIDFPNLINVIVTISENGVEKSTMENLYKWKVIP